MTAPNRRTVLAATACVLAGGAIAASVTAAHPDAELIALAAEAERLEHEYCRLCWATDRQEPSFGTPEQVAAAAEFEAVSEAHTAVYAQLGEIQATTLDGLRAKARAIKAYYGNDEPERGSASAALWSIILHLAEGGAVT